MDTAAARALDRVRANRLAIWAIGSAAAILVLQPEVLPELGAALRGLRTPP